MEEIWCSKRVESLTEKEKIEIINIVFDACVDNDELCDIGGEIFSILQRKKYLWKEEIED